MTCFLGNVCLSFKHAIDCIDTYNLSENEKKALQRGLTKKDLEGHDWRDVEYSTCTNRSGTAALRYIDARYDACPRGAFKEIKGLDEYQIRAMASGLSRQQVTQRNGLSWQCDYWSNEKGSTALKLIERAPEGKVQDVFSTIQGRPVHEIRAIATGLKPEDFAEYRWENNGLDYVDGRYSLYYLEHKPKEMSAQQVMNNLKKVGQYYSDQRELAVYTCEAQNTLGYSRESAYRQIFTRAHFNNVVLNRLAERASGKKIHLPPEVVNKIDKFVSWFSDDQFIRVAQALSSKQTGHSHSKRAR